jgi:hypothetical protein
MNPLPSDTAVMFTLCPVLKGGMNGLILANNGRLTILLAETFTTAPLVLATTSTVTVRRKLIGGPSAKAGSEKIIKASNKQLRRIMLILSNIDSRYYIPVCIL